jgi:hypothetical protein
MSRDRVIAIDANYLTELVQKQIVRCNAHCFQRSESLCDRCPGDRLVAAFKNATKSANPVPLALPAPAARRLQSP